MAKKQETKDDIAVAEKNWERYRYARQVGQDGYIKIARLNEDFYLGGGLQWVESDRQLMEKTKRPMIELNHVMPAVQTALGMQLHSRVDIEFQPRGEGADDKTAEVLSKVIMQVADQVEYHWKESLQFEDGLIQQRGFLDFRVDFDRNFQGEIVCDVLDPMDVLPDPDAQGYEPDKWQDVTVVRWMTYDDIGLKYGKDKAKELSHLADQYFEDDEYGDRAHFGDDADGIGYDGWVEEDEKFKSRRYMVIDRQSWQTSREPVIVYYTGEVKPLEGMTNKQIAKALEMGIKTVHDVRRVKWTVTCGRTVLFDGWSPYRTFTIIPYFPIFRRGRTRGMVDNLRSPQELENKSITSYLEILNTTANSGWDVEEGSLVNMEPEDLATYGSKNGLVLVYREGSTPPQRRLPNTPPTGANLLTDRAEYAIKTISGMSDAMQGQQGNEVSGVAIQSKQYQGQMQMGRPFDNLALTRRMAARKVLELVQMFYTEERVFRIIDPTTKMVEEIIVNQVDETGGILNDITVGRYDVVVSDTPTHATFQQNQFDQLVALAEKDVPVPPKYLLEASTVTNKHEIAQEIEAIQQQQGDPEVESKIEENMAHAELRRAQAEKTKAETVNAGVDAQYSAMQAAGVIAATPETAPMADQLLRSAGYQDKDQPPIVPEYTGETAVSAALPPNTNPTTPVPVPEPGSPAVGVNSGIETQEIEGNR
jgi:hypothetical protein